MSDEMVSMEVNKLVRELDDIFHRLIGSKTWKSLQKYMREKDVYSIRKENAALVDGTIKYMSTQQSLAEAKEALETENDDIVYLIGERVTSVMDYLSKVPNTDQLTVPQSGRERFLWLLTNKELSNNSEISNYNW